MTTNQPQPDDTPVPGWNIDTSNPAVRRAVWGPGPFSATKKVRKGFCQLTLDEALTEARGAGFRETAHSKATRAHVQQSWNNAATIRPVPGGVVIKPAWTTAQVWIVVGVLFLLLFGVCIV